MPLNVAFEQFANDVFIKFVKDITNRRIYGGCMKHWSWQDRDEGGEIGVAALILRGLGSTRQAAAGSP